MLKNKNVQLSFIDTELFSKMIPQDHPLVDIHNSIDFSFVTTEMESLYSKYRGRPGWDPEVLFRILYLEFWANLSDVQICRELQYNILYRWFCRLSLDDATPDDTTLVVFRRRLKEHGLDEKFFNHVIDQARDKNLLGGRWAIIDGTRIETYATARSHIQFLRHGRHKIANMAIKVDPTLADDENLSKLITPVKEDSSATQTEVLNAEQERGAELLDYLKDLTDDKLKEVMDLYQTALDGEGTCSLVDPDARWGHQKANEAFCGYKTVAICDESGIVTAATVVSGNQSELPQAEIVMQKLQERKIKPKAFAGDAAYESNKLREKLAKQEIKTYVPSRRRKSAQIDDFSYDKKTGKVVCPKGKKSVGRSEHKNRKGFVYYFSTYDCQACPLKDQCLSKTQKRKQIFIDPLTEAYRPRGLKQASRIRKTIERAFGDAKYWHNMARSRYVGLVSTNFHVFMTYLVINTKKMAKMLAT